MECSEIRACGFGASLAVVTLVSTFGAQAACGCATPPADAPPSEVVLEVESYPAELLGALAYYESERLAALPAALTDVPRDVVCLHNIMRDEHKSILAQAVRDIYPYAYWEPADLTMGPDDPTDLHGVAPPAPTAPPCAGDPMPLAEKAIACIQENCSTIPNDPAGHTNRASCGASKCASEAFVLFADAAGRRCLSCLYAEFLSLHSFQMFRDRCMGDVQAGLAFDGTGNGLLLSRYPIDTTNARTVLLPSTMFRRQILYAPIHVAGSSVDLYCASMTTPYGSSFVPYGGDYGDGAMGSEAWSNERQLQVEKILALIRSQSGSRPALLMALDDASVRAQRDGEVLVNENRGAPMFALLDAQLDVAVPESYVPQCLFCADNPLAGVAPPGTWSHRVWLSNIPPANVQSASRVHTERVVSVPDDPELVLPEDGLVPPSAHYGLVVGVRVPLAR